MVGGSGEGDVESEQAKTGRARPTWFSGGGHSLISSQGTSDCRLDPQWGLQEAANQ